MYVKNEADDSVLKIIDEKDLRAAAALPENYQFEKRKPLIKAFNDGINWASALNKEEDKL